MVVDRTSRPARRQVAALCWRLGGAGELEFVLVTSRDTGRWVTPKGNRMLGLSDSVAAAQEAFEEAGVRGLVDEAPIGVFHYEKRLSANGRRDTAVDLYPLEVRSVLARWPEASERTRRWFARLEAVEAVDEPELKDLIASFVPA